MGGGFLILINYYFYINMAYAITIISSKGKRILVALRESILKNGTSFFETKSQAKEFIKNKLPQKSLKAKIVSFHFHDKS
jgi:hypothetical protein